MPQITQIFLSPGHNFFGHYGQPAGDHETVEVEDAQCVSGKGLLGDRFFDYKENYEGQVTFFSKEVYDSLCQQFQVWDKPVSVLRRNIIVEGVDLNGWIGVEFEVQGVRFFGSGESKPCFWMNEAFAPGAEQALSGQGGLRAKILTDGVLRLGAIPESDHTALAS